MGFLSAGSCRAQLVHSAMAVYCQASTTMKADACVGNQCEGVHQGLILSMLSSIVGMKEVTIAIRTDTPLEMLYVGDFALRDTSLDNRGNALSDHIPAIGLVLFSAWGITSAIRNVQDWWISSSSIPPNGISPNGISPNGIFSNVIGILCLSRMFERRQGDKH